MSINLKISNSLEKLADALGDHILDNPLPVFSRELIITQTTGMNRWLSIFLAERNKIFANFEYLRPNTFIDEIFNLAGIEHSRLYQPEFLKWIFFSILDSRDFKNQFPDRSRIRSDEGALTDADDGDFTHKISLKPYENIPFGPITVLAENFNPRNTQGMPAVKISGRPCA